MIIVELTCTIDSSEEWSEGVMVPRLFDIGAVDVELREHVVKSFLHLGSKPYNVEIVEKTLCVKFTMPATNEMSIVEGKSLQFADKAKAACLGKFSFEVDDVTNTEEEVE